MEKIWNNAKFIYTEFQNYFDASKIRGAAESLMLISIAKLSIIMDCRCFGVILIS